MTGARTGTESGALSIEERPSLEETTGQYRGLEGELKEAVSEIVPGGIWTRYGSDKTPSCREDDGHDDPRARRLVSASWGLKVRPTVEQWARIREHVLRQLAEHGFERILMDTTVGDGAVLKVAGPHEGSDFSIQYSKAIALSFSTGCHLP